VLDREGILFECLQHTRLVTGSSFCDAMDCGKVDLSEPRSKVLDYHNIMAMQRHLTRGAQERVRHSLLL
jgi:hypothetical protein